MLNNTLFICNLKEEISKNAKCCHPNQKQHHKVLFLFFLSLPALPLLLCFIRIA